MRILIRTQWVISNYQLRGLDYDYGLVGAIGAEPGSWGARAHPGISGRNEVEIGSLSQKKHPSSLVEEMMWQSFE